MKESAFVISTEKDLATVKVSSESHCDHCSLLSLCQKQKGESGIIAVSNPLRALPGDQVEIEVPEANYNKEILLLFGPLLAACLLGLTLGYLAASLFDLPLSATCLFALLLAVGLAAAGLFRLFKARTRSNLYPVIIAIIKQGGSHG